jgi:hypothetical protein
MNTNDIVSEIDAEISRLRQARVLLINAETASKRKPGGFAGVGSTSKATSFNPSDFAGKSKAVRSMSPEARARIAAAQKARWAKSKKAAKKAARNAAAASASKTPIAKGGAKKTAAVKQIVSAKKAVRPGTKTSATLAL